MIFLFTFQGSSTENRCFFDNALNMCGEVPISKCGGNFYVIDRKSLYNCSNIEMKPSSWLFLSRLVCKCQDVL